MVVESFANPAKQGGGGPAISRIGGAGGLCYRGEREKENGIAKNGLRLIDAEMHVDGADRGARVTVARNTQQRINKR